MLYLADRRSTSHVPLKTTVTQENQFNLRLKTHHNQHKTAKRKLEKLEWIGVIGSLTSATIASNFELSELLSRGIQSISSF